MTTHLEELDRSRTIRELGGEVWSELSQRIPEEDADWKTRGKLVDIVMGVLARHAGKLIENDKDMPVEPLLENPKG